MKSEAPLATGIRPRTLDKYIGQEHIVGEGKLLRRAIEADKFFSFILWGPPGTGKTTLEQVIANTTKSHFVTISAILAGKAELREAIKDALERRRLHNEHSVLFVKEISETSKRYTQYPDLACPFTRQSITNEEYSRFKRKTGVSSTVCGSVRIGTDSVQMF
jgi:replication-associated recombination protein RarA